MTVNGHPDDETVTAGGVMARYAAEGNRVVCVVATRGEVGKIVARDLDSPANYANLGAIREQELRRALARLGVHELFLLDYRDSGMAGTSENSDPRSFWQADREEAVGRLVEIVRTVRPQVIIAPNSFGADGHPDHIRASEIAAAAYERAGDPDAFPQQLIGGLRPWAPSKLYEAVDQLSRSDKVRMALAEGGILRLVSMAFRVARHWRPGRERLRSRMRAAQGVVTTRVDISPYIAAKYTALREHRTQIAPDSDRFALSPEERRQINPTEDFTLKASRLGVTTPETDLFAGLRADPT